MKDTPVSGQLWDAARTLRARVRSFFDAPVDAAAAPLELLHAALETLEGKVQPSGRGARVFPYNRVTIHVTQPGADRPAIEAVFTQLDARLRQRLTELRCEIPSSLTTSVSVGEPEDGSEPVLRVACANDAGAPVAVTADPRATPELHVRILKGQCESADYTFTADVVSVGRGTEPSDAFGRIRRNHVAFLDVRDGITETVARAHARFEIDPATGACLLFNESTTNPTFLVRGGRSMRITPRDRRGVRVASGDEVQLGRALIAVTLEDRATGRAPHVML
jgi:hypothetical protein